MSLRRSGGVGRGGVDRGQKSCLVMSRGISCWKWLEGGVESNLSTLCTSISTKLLSLSPHLCLTSATNSSTNSNACLCTKYLLSHKHHKTLSTNAVNVHHSIIQYSYLFQLFSIYISFNYSLLIHEWSIEKIRWCWVIETCIEKRGVLSEVEETFQTATQRPRKLLQSLLGEHSGIYLHHPLPHTILHAHVTKQLQQKWTRVGLQF